MDRIMIQSSSSVRRGIVIVFAFSIAITLGTMAVVSPVAASTDEPNDVERIAQIDFAITDEEFYLSDVNVSGSSLPDAYVENESYTIEQATLTADGIRFTFNDKTYIICEVNIVVENVSLVIEDVGLSSE